MQPPGPQNKPSKPKPTDNLGADLRRLEWRFWLATAVSFLAVFGGGLIIVYAPAADPRIVAFGLLIAICGALSWAVLKIMTYFKVAVMFMLREAKGKDKA